MFVDQIRDSRPFQVNLTVIRIIARVIAMNVSARK